MLTVYKEKGQTPLEVIQKLKESNPSLRNIPMTYAGRLDPLAEGVLLILSGDECLKKDEYLALPKEYEVTILFGFATDTYDVLGKIEKFQSNNLFDLDSLKNKLATFLGRIVQAYPPYSSRTVDGKPLFQWAREGKLDQIVIPSHDVYVQSIDIVKDATISGEKLHKKITKDINLVRGDFRQIEILEIWKDVLSGQQEVTFPTLKIKITCGSGVYVRSIAHELGQAVGVSALALDIVRTKIGDYSSKDCE